MTRSIFDPTGPDMEKGRGNQFLGEQGANFSHMPPSLQEQPAQDKQMNEEPGTEAANNDEAAERLVKMVQETPPKK